MRIDVYCIICRTKINYDVNFPFCRSCFEPFKNKKITYKIDGNYCHLCGKKNNKIDNIQPLCIYCRPFDRKDNSISDIYIEKLSWYIDENRTHQIKPKWNITNKDSIKQIKILDIVKIISETSNINIQQIFKNTPENIKRIINILHLWEFGLSCDPPILEEENKTIKFKDGRHRVLSAYLTGCKNIPIILEKL